MGFDVLFAIPCDCECAAVCQRIILNASACSDGTNPVARQRIATAPHAGCDTPCRSFLTVHERSNQGAVVHVAGLRTASTTCLIASITSCGSWA